MVFYFLASLGAVTRAFGDFRDPIYGVVTAILLGFVWQAFPRVPSWASWINWIFKWSCWLVFVGIVSAAHPVLQITFITLALWLFDRFGAAEVRGRYRALIYTGILYGLWWTVFFQLPVPYRWLTDLSNSYSQLISQVMSVPLILGPSAMAMDISLLAIASLMAVTLTSTLGEFPTVGNRP